ncbi:MAG: (E)-4-hydroxy-3-methylbut-2-enyl-diphosphate synthase [FCB group bacterium]|nr:(E)-4-hydroxy-3-methylbut-2-enyl-diphosphate synthase [FCB group bacterium]
MTVDKNGNYLPSLRYKRWTTRVVEIGDVPMGGGNPIRIQSMTTTNTMDVTGTVEQSIRMIRAGCEYVRITAPGINEAKNLAVIRQTLNNRGYAVPLIADIHYTPKAAEIAARIVEKVRINPGNYHDRKQKGLVEYSDSQNAAEFEKIYQKFSPLVKICKEYGTALRIGTNHGSLSQRIMSRFGDTPLGMVESALEYIRICEDLNFYKIVLSMKSSNPLVMVQAYRLLVRRMLAENMNYPLHLGVTEAGEGIEGRIKSAVGIGTLLEDGLGDTIRVSLTEEPEREIPVAKQIVRRYHERRSPAGSTETQIARENPFEAIDRRSPSIENIGGDHPPVVIQTAPKLLNDSVITQLGFRKTGEDWIPQTIHADYLYCGDDVGAVALPDTLGLINNPKQLAGHDSKKAVTGVLLTRAEYRSGEIPADMPIFLQVNAEEIPACLEEIDTGAIIVLTSHERYPLHQLRTAIFELGQHNIKNPVVIKNDYHDLQDSDFLISSSIDLGALLVDGLCDGVWIERPGEFALDVVFTILQAARARITKTDFISCPSCGRTLFDLQETSARIRERTGHLKGLKIAIMGCIVNGPGEMADADYGYVGTGKGRVSLYRGKTAIKKNLATEVAVDELLDLIRSDGNWREPDNDPVKRDNRRVK